MILQKIIDGKKSELKKRKNKLPFPELAKLVNPGKRRSLISAVAGKPFFIIAETKKASPSAGIIKKRYFPARNAAAYERAGASAVSVITESKFFLGKPEDLEKVRKAVKIPVLMKDFIFDPYQIYEAKFYGADIVLFIYRILGQDLLKKLLKTADKLNLEVLVEVHEKKEIKDVLNIIGSRKNVILGINNRNLDTLVTDLQITLDLISYTSKVKIPVISESGIKNSGQIKRLFKAGVKGILIGEHLLRAKNPSAEIKKLFNGGK